MSNFGEESIELELFPTPCLMAPWAVVYVLMHVYKCLRDSVVRLSKVECCLRLLTQDEWMVKGTSFGAIVFIVGLYHVYRRTIFSQCTQLILTSFICEV